MCCAITHVELKDPRMVGIALSGKSHKLLNVHLPYDKHDNFVKFIEYLGRIQAIIAEGEYNHVLVVGDFNADPGKHFGHEMGSFTNECNLHSERLGPDSDTSVADPGGGGGGCPGGPDPPFGPRCRLFNIGPKVGPPLGPPPLLLVDLRCPPPPRFQKSWIRPCTFTYVSDAHGSRPTSWLDHIITTHSAHYMNVLEMCLYCTTLLARTIRH